MAACHVVPSSVDTPSAYPTPKLSVAAYTTSPRRESARMRRRTRDRLERRAAVVRSVQRGRRAGIDERAQQPRPARKLHVRREGARDRKRHGDGRAAVPRERDRLPVGAHHPEQDGVRVRGIDGDDPRDRRAPTIGPEVRHRPGARRRRPTARAWAPRTRRWSSPRRSRAHRHARSRRRRSRRPRPPGRAAHRRSRRRRATGTRRRSRRRIRSPARGRRRSGQGRRR